MKWINQWLHWWNELTSEFIDKIILLVIQGWKFWKLQYWEYLKSQDDLVHWYLLTLPLSFVLCLFSKNKVTFVYLNRVSYNDILLSRQKMPVAICWKIPISSEEEIGILQKTPELFGIFPRDSVSCCGIINFYTSPRTWIYSFLKLNYSRFT